MSEIELRDAAFVPPPGCALHGVTRHKNELHFLSIAPAAGGGYWVSAGEPGSAPELIKWTGTATPVAPDLLSRLVARVSDADWSAATWTARHALEIGGSCDEAVTLLRDIADWLRAEQFVVRRFSPDMSLATVTKLSGDWHEAVAANMSGSEYEFPEPWCPGGESGGFDIVPITNSSELYREGLLMHHCVGTYADRVHRGDCYVFSVRKDKERIATLELIKNGASVEIGQLRGACNSQAPKDVVRAVKSWLRSQRGFRFPPNPAIIDKNNDDEALIRFRAA